MKRRCVDCLAYVEGECRRVPPKFGKFDEEGDARFWFPDVEDDSWCLEFIARISEDER